MGIYQQGTEPPKIEEEKKVKGLVFEKEFYDNIMKEDGFVSVRPKADVEFVSVDEDKKTIEFKVVGTDGDGGEIQQPENS